MQGLLYVDDTDSMVVFNIIILTGDQTKVLLISQAVQELNGINIIRIIPEFWMLTISET